MKCTEWNKRCFGYKYSISEFHTNSYKLKKVVRINGLTLITKLNTDNFQKLGLKNNRFDFPVKFKTKIFNFEIEKKIS